MKLDELLAEYAESLRPAAGERGLPAFEELLRPRRRSLRYVWWAAAAAAVVVLALALPREQRPVTRVASEPAPLPQPEVTRPAPLVQASAVAPSPRRSPVARALAKPRSPLPERPFVPLAENSMLPAPAFVQMVRVSVRRERLAELGIAAQGGPAGELVDTEVLLGDDGIARALRVLGGE